MHPTKASAIGFAGKCLVKRIACENAEAADRHPPRGYGRCPADQPQAEESFPADQCGFEAPDTPLAARSDGTQCILPRLQSGRSQQHRTRKRNHPSNDHTKASGGFSRLGNWSHWLFLRLGATSYRAGHEELFLDLAGDWNYDLRNIFISRSDCDILVHLPRRKIR